ncbi:GH92 family glycosyl hydrolase [Glaciihabitans sp. UYNi722]|uniref:GH92 family glycosyl hydrolase n=1 Tax=Glaciihabitans sp. UYNi722 TaxID=3156344 RepID=UPI003390AE3E
MSMVLALLGSGIQLASEAGSANAATPTFLSSFESGDPQPQASTPYGTQVNVTGKIPPGSLSAYVTGVTASAENPPGEAATKLLDNNSNTKWLAFVTTATIVYQFGTPVVATDYAMTSANDSPERDPKNFTVEGSNDGSTWIPIDSQTNQVFTARQTEKDYKTTNTTAYGSYRLSITANAGAPLTQPPTQLADWDLRDASTGATPMLSIIAGGPANGPDSKSGVGFSGTHALRYGGKHVADGAASASNVLYDNMNQPIAGNTELSYLVFPDSSSDLAVPSSWVAIDLVLDDGTTLSQKVNLVDNNGFGVTARDHGQQKSLFENQWNAVHVDLGSLAGRTVDKILLSYDYPTGSASTVFSGWIDDVRLGAAPATIDGSSRVNYVDTRRGTLSSSSFSRGTNIPATAMPNGFNFFTPMTDGGSQGTLYEYQRANNTANLPTLQAIGISHEPSIWMGDRDQLGIMPSLSAVPTGDLAARALAFTHADEIARPDLYSVKFQNNLVTEVTPTDHGGIYRFQFPGATGSVVVDRVGGSSSLTVAADGTVSGWVDGGNGSGISRMFVSGAFDKTPTAVGTATGGRTDARYASFSTTAGEIVQLRLATSFISLAQAKKNLDLEVTGRTFAEVNTAAAAAWNDRLKVIDVQGATDNQRVTLYSNLYRMNLYPNSQFENTGTANAPVYKHASPVAPQTGVATDTATNAQIVDGKIYVNNGFWDTYRTVWPLYNLLYPKVAAELVDGFTQQYREGGWIARWSSPGYSDIMTGTSSDVAFADAYLNGALPTATALDAYDAALKNATVLPPSNNVGRKSLDTSIFLGYTPDSQGESVSWGLEGYINDHGIGLMAAKLATDPKTPDARRSTLTEESNYFLDRATNYVQMFDPATGFFRPKTAAGAVSGGANFDPTAWWGPYTETDAWNFAFHAPFDIPGLESLYGGSTGLVTKLDQFFATPETGGGGNIHEMLEARAVRMGQLGMSNQPSHHIPYLYAAAGDPSKTQAAVREIQQRLYVGSEIGQGYLGDEDNGEMSSWSIFSALGFYPLSLGSGNYEIGSPLFTKSTVHLENGKDLVINAPNNSTKNRYIASASVNGTPIDTATLSHDAIANGGTVDFQMSANPTTWGNHTSAAKPVPTPRTDATKAGYGTMSVSDASSIAALTDDNSRGATTFATATPAITWTSSSGAVAVDEYTLTSGASGAAPKSWHLDGSADGVNWMLLDTRTNEAFTWQTQTRPFAVKKPGSFTRYRLTIDETTTGAPATMAELELLATPGTVGDLAVTPSTGLTASVGASLSSTLATVSGGTATKASDYTVTADFKDGKGPQPATLTKTPLGTWSVVLPHTFTESGEYSITVTASDGTSQASTVVPISISRDGTLVGSFDTNCIGDPGVGANCDSKNWAFNRSLLANSGFVQGTTVSVPGTVLTFDLPAVAAGTPDSATGNGQTIRLDLGTGATSMSVIGTGTQATQHTTGTLTFSDGTTAPLPIDFGDWVGAASNPVSGGIVVGTSAGRLSGASASDGQTAGIFSTAPYSIPAGKTVVSLTLPTQTGDPGSAGRIHVFAIASDGKRVGLPALSATATAIKNQNAKAAFTANLATVSGGTPATPGSYTARINWGDGTALVDATVTAATGTNPAVISGGHTYAKAGDYPVAVTADDGVTSTVVRSTVHVVQLYSPSLDVVPGAVAPGATVAITGSGFEPGESVTVTLGATPAVPVTVTANSSGAIRATVTIPTGTGDATYSVIARGSVSAVNATTSVVVKAVVVTPPAVASFVLSSSAGERGATVQARGDHFPGNSTVTFTLHSDPITLGTATVNAEGVFTANLVIPAAATTGSHQIEATATGVTLTAPFTVVNTAPADLGKAPIANPGKYHGLAHTGADAAKTQDSLNLALSLIGGGIVLALLGFFLRRRMRRRNSRA